VRVIRHGDRKRWLLPGAGRDEGTWYSAGTLLQFGKMKRVLKTEDDIVLLMPLNCTLKTVKRINVMLCVFYHNF
jgi:hypothetical protein